MKKIASYIQSHQPLYFLVIFLLMIFPALLLFLAAMGENQAGMFIFLGIVVLANLTAIFPINSK